MSSAYSQTKLILDGLLELLACGKCKKTPTRPMRYINCEHFFCYACMYGETICFKCKIPLSPHDIRPCRMVDQLIDYCQIVKNAIAEIKSEDLKTLSKAIRVFTTQSNGVVPETDSESEDDVVEPTPPGQRSSQKKNTQLETSGCLAPKRLKMDQGTEELVPDDKEYVDASRLHSHQGKQDSVPETAGYISATQLSPHRRKNDVQNETAGFVDPTQFSPHQRKQNLQPETAGFIDPTQFSPHQRKHNIQPETAGFVSPQFSPHQRKQNCELETAGFVSPTQFSLHQRKQNLEPESAGFVSPTQFSPHQRKQNLEPETAGFVSPTQFSPRIRKQNLQPETAGFVSPTQFSPRIRKQNLQPETAGFVSPTQFSPRIRKQNLQPETAGFVSPTQFSPRIRKQNLQPETAGFVSPTQFSPDQRKHDFEPETAGFVDPTQFSPHPRKQNIDPDREAYADPGQLNQSHCKSDLEPETAGYLDGMQTPPSRKKKRFRSDTCKFLTLRTRQRRKTLISESPGSYVDPTQRDPVENSESNRADQCVDGNSSVAGPAGFIDSPLGNNDDTAIGQPTDARRVDPTRRDQTLDGAASVKSAANFVNPVDKRAEVNSQPVTVGHRDPTEITRCPTNADFLESAEIFDSAPGVRRHREIDVQHKVPETNSCERVDGKEKTVGLQESSVFQEWNTDLVLAPESMEVREITSKKVFISESPENDEKAPSCRNSPMEIDNDCMEKSSPTKFSRDQDASTISVVVDKTTKSAAIREETPFEKLKRIKSLALKRLRKIRQISQDCTKPIETDTREKSSGKKRSIEEDASHDGREKKSSTEPDHTSVSTGQTFGDETDGFVQKTPKRLRRTRNPSSEEQHLPLHFRNANTAKTIDSNATTVEIEQEIRSAMDTRQRDNDNEKFVIGHETRFDPVNGRTESSGREKVQKCVQQLRSVENLDNEAHTRKCEEQLMQLKSRRDIDKSRSAGSKSVPKNVNKRNAKGETTLHTACVKGQADYVKTLLEAGANPNTKDNANWTPLQEAVNLGHREICKMLLQAGASANTPAMDNRTALHEAAENNRLEEATLLLRFNANKNVYDKFGKKPIDYAVSEEIRTLLADETKIDAIIDNDLYVEPALDQSIIIPNAKVIVLPSHLSSQNRKLLAQLAFKLKVEVATTFRSTVTHVVVETNDRNITELTYDVMLAILQGKWILNSQWITISTDLNDISDIDLEMFEVRGAPNPETPTRARINEEKQNPRLFNNCFFYFAIGPRCTWSYEKFEFTKESLTTLVLGGQGEILNREPDPEDVKDYKLTPFHVAHKPIHPLYRCSHYIIYMPGKDEPRVKYNMPHIKSLPVGWFLECIEKFTLVDPVLMGITYHGEKYQEGNFKHYDVCCTIEKISYGFLDARSLRLLRKKKKAGRCNVREV